MDNLSLQVTPDHRLVLENAPFPTLSAHCVVIHPRCTGVCGTDLHWYKNGAIGEMVVHDNMIIGHEAAGDIVAVGSAVQGFKVGDRVAIEPQMPCMKCHYCRDGKLNLCLEVAFMGCVDRQGPTPGSLQRFVSHDARFVHKIPDSMTYSQAALVEPVSVGYRGVQRSTIELGKGVVVLGAGPIGLSTLILARAKGATPLVVTDIDDRKLEFAKQLVPEVQIYKVDPKLDEVANATRCRNLFFGNTEYQAPPAVLECTGIASSIITGAYLVRRGGCLTVIGVGKSTVDKFPFMHLSFAEIDVKFVNRYYDTWPAVINLIANKIINVDPMVTHTFPLEQAKKALDTCADPNTLTVKVQIEDNTKVVLPDCYKNVHHL
ncbi:hypothetical protein DASC09_021500 [Saccharomycopsis crataegensis]|uniref:Enoyl reductase (ER) domain-containing protein n=1 Tax=Saccharomycopsis crataegensis TaxID=43959 RepID=A0AAV5QIR2_9ASCO|nr:hypothetical protein DASC09_021500 [Saccharomycopsis crataegensis]